ncbi:MAG: hypothetical protein V2I62_04885, partial [Bacteroidales bacterium]|nr:hypothetical protein [Bacteroidales bacterium]
RSRQANICGLSPRMPIRFKLTVVWLLFFSSRYCRARFIARLMESIDAGFLIPKLSDSPLADKINAQ